MEVDSSNDKDGKVHSSQIFNLFFLPRYLLKVVHYENSGDSYVEVGAKFYDTEFTNVWTGKAEQEVQTIAITSTVVYDVQVSDELLYLSKCGIMH